MCKTPKQTNDAKKNKITMLALVNVHKYHLLKFSPKDICDLRKNVFFFDRYHLRVCSKFEVTLTLKSYMFGPVCDTQCRAYVFNLKKNTFLCALYYVLYTIPPSLAPLVHFFASSRKAKQTPT